MQVVQLAEPGSAYEPEGQVVQTEPPALADDVFAGQGVHDTCPGAAAMLPAAQSVQPWLPLTGAKVPIGQL